MLAILVGTAAVPPVCDGIVQLKKLPNETAILYPNKNGWYGRQGTGEGQFDPSPFLAQARTYAEGVSCQTETPNTYCVQSEGKANCAEFYTAEVLNDTRTKLTAGGYNCFSRHERTYWHQYSGERGCKKAANCVEVYNDPAHPYRTVSRYLSPWGHQASVHTANAIKSLGLDATVDRAASSPFPRCLVGLQHAFPDATSDELLMYTGSALENVKRKGACDTRMNSTADEIKSKLVADAESGYLVNELVFDGLRKLAGTPPAAGKNNFYSTHGLNMKGAFGQQIDEGYMMCLKPTDQPYPLAERQHDVCSCATCPQPKVDFTGVKEFGLAFIVSSEAFPLMDELAKAPAKTGIYADGVLEETEVPTTAAWNKLIALQTDVIASTKVGVSAPADKFHLHTFAHVNGGYRDAVAPSSLETVHVPLRAVHENSITSQAQFAIVQAIVDHSDGVDYATCHTIEDYDAVKTALARCYAHDSEPSWYWGGKNKAEINAQQTFTNPQTYGQVAWQGNPSWFAAPYQSPFVDAAACLVSSDKVTLSAMMTSMGCAGQFETCDTIQGAYQASGCCGADAAQVSTIAS